MTFGNLDPYSKIYLIIAIISTVIFVIKLILMMIGGDHHDSLEIDAEVHSGTGSDSAFVLFSIESILAFLMGFGWSGLAIKNEWHFPTFISASMAFAFGLMMMLFIAYLMMQVKKLGQTSSFNIHDCVGKTGSAYTDLKKDKQGQVKIIVSGKLRILNAINRVSEKIDAFSSVIVTDIEDNNLIVDNYNGGKESGTSN